MTIGDSGSVTVSVDASSLADGPLTAAVTLTDVFGNGVTLSQASRLDTTPPTVTATLQAPPATNSGWYDVGATISFGFGASDASGAVTTAKLDSATTSGGWIDLDTLTAGTHTIVVTATDTAGNVSTTTTVFQVHATLAGLLAAVNAGAAKGLIKTAVEQAALIAQLQSATKGNSAHSKLPAFISMVQSQSGISIDAGYAALLLNWADDLLLRV